MNNTAPPHPLAPCKKRSFHILLIIGILIMLALFTFGLGTYIRVQHMLLPGTQIQEEQAFPTRAPTPTPTRIRQGKEVYTINQGSGTKGPKFSQVVMDPHDPAKGQTQTMQVAVQNTNPVTEVTITLKTDHEQQVYKLKKTKGTDVDGIWSGSWKTTDTHLYTYKITIGATSASYTSSIDIVIRNYQ